MVTRENFQTELEKIKNMIIHFAQDTEKVLNTAIDALYNQDIDLANKIILEDRLLNEQDTSINDEAILLIAKQQPVASDLRRLIVALRISSDLERMADNAKNIAKSTIHLGEGHGLEVHPSLKDMKKIAFNMLDIAIEAYQMEDISLARNIAKMDDMVDSLYGEITRQLLKETATNPEKIQHIMQMAFCARYIERFADHCTNIGESILYLVKGESVDLNN